MSEKKHILFLTWKDIRHPHAGWAELVMYEYAKWLVAKGYRVTWFASLAPGLNTEENIDGIHVIRKYTNHTIWIFAWRWYHSFRKQEHVDVIIDEAGGWPLLSPLYEKRIPIVFFAHHIGDKEFEAFGMVIGGIAKHIYRALFPFYRSTQTIAVSESTKQELIEEFSFDDTKISVISNATHIVPIEHITYETKTNDFVFVGRLTRIKRPDHAIRAFHTIVSDIPPDSRLHIIGNNQDREYTESLHSLVHELGLEKRVVFHGYLSSEEYTKILRESLCLLVPSEKEGFGLVVIEGNSYGLPAIGYDVAWLRDSIRVGENGVLVRDGDFSAMGQGMLLMLDNEKYKSLAESSLAHAKSRHTWTENVDAFEAIITSSL